MDKISLVPFKVNFKQDFTDGSQKFHLFNALFRDSKLIKGVRVHIFFNWFRVSFQLARSLTASTLTTVTDNTTAMESSSESSANVTVVVIDNDPKEEEKESRSPSVER